MVAGIGATGEIAAERHVGVAEIYRCHAVAVALNAVGLCAASCGHDVEILDVLNPREAGIVVRDVCRKLRAARARRKTVIWICGPDPDFTTGLQVAAEWRTAVGRAVFVIVVPELQFQTRSLDVAALKVAEMLQRHVDDISAYILVAVGKIAIVIPIDMNQPLGLCHNSNLQHPGHAAGLR